MSLVGQVDPNALQAEIAPLGSAELAGAPHPLLPAELAPARFLPAVARLTDRFPFERNVFCMTRFPAVDADENDPMAETIDLARKVLKEHGLVMHLASDRNADDELFGNVSAYIWASKYGIAFLETFGEPKPDEPVSLNDNVLIELGAMLVTGRRCGLLKDVSAPHPPTDFVAQIYKEIDLADESVVRETISDWVTEDLGL
jgi:hypothetical protein